MPIRESFAMHADVVVDETMVTVVVVVVMKKEIERRKWSKPPCTNSLKLVKHL